MVEINLAQIILNAIFTGIGVTIGTYFSNRFLIRNIEKFGRINNKNRRNKK